MLHDFTDRFAAFILGSHQADAWAAFVMREQLHPGAAFEILYEGFMRDVTRTIAVALAAIAGLEPDNPRVIVRAQSIIGEILVFRVGKTAALRTAGWKSYSPGHLSLIQSVVRENVDRIVGGVA